MSTGVVLFRAQPFHNGHLKTIEFAAIDCEKVFVFVGSADKSHTERNPLPIDIRLDLVKNLISHLNNVTVVSLRDLTEESDNSNEWGLYLYNSIISTTGFEETDFTMYYCDDPQIMLSWFIYPYMRRAIAFKFLARFDEISATKIRAAIKEKDILYLKRALPSYVYKNISNLEEYFIDFV